MNNNKNGSNEVKQGRVKYARISKGQFSEEYIVTLIANQGQLTGIFSSSDIDKDDETITVFVVAEKEDSYLVDLPAYTFTTGSKVWFPKDAVLLEG